jgi:heavy metal translocating P-type ATPase
MASTAGNRKAARELVLLSASLIGLASGGVAAWVGAGGAADLLWALTTAVALVPALAWVIGALRERRAGVDLIAVLALVGTLAVHELLAGAVIAVMLASGRALEARAGARAERDLKALLAVVPRVVHRHAGGTLTTPPLDEVVPGDLLLVQPGELVPVDGLVEGGRVVLDESSLTGEPLPVEREAGDVVRSGAVNAGPPFDLRATTTAEASTYAGIVRLVREAQAGSAPFVRLADRYAAWFLPFTLALAGLAWLLSGQLLRAVAVLVVATPCPLLLAAPVAIVSGLSRAARRGVIIKGGGALERLAGGRVLLFDKTGTVTVGRPTVTDVVAPAALAAGEVLRLAASLDQVSPHVLAAAVVRAARRRGLSLVLPTDVEEVAGLGIRGTVDGRAVAVGRAGWVAPGRAPGWLRAVRRRAGLDGALTSFVAVDGEPVGALLLDDPIRPDAARTIRDLRRDGIHRVIMVTGDRLEIAEAVATAIGVDEVLAERTPAEKVEAVRAAGRLGATIMVGDGVNDAPALATASVGVAVGARGQTASSEASEVVLSVDRLDRLGDAIRIARRARRIALQSVLAGMGLSLLAMVAAMLGRLPPTAGALLQEAIDVAVILNALRALSGGLTAAPRLDGAAAELVRRFSREHQVLRPELERIRAAAGALGGRPAAGAVAEARAVQQWLVSELLPHEDAENQELYPALQLTLGGDATGTMSRAHVEIRHLVGRLGRLLDEVGPGTLDPDDVRELQQALYGLYAVLRLHFAQEEEGFFALAEEVAEPAASRA